MYYFLIIVEKKKHLKAGEIMRIDVNECPTLHILLGMVCRREIFVFVY